MTTSQEVNWFFRIAMIIIPKPVFLGFLAITNLCMQSKRSFLENDTLCQSVYSEFSKSYAGLNSFKYV